MCLDKTKIVVEKLIKKEKTVSTMESCTGGGIANYITNIGGSSAIFKFGVVTYSNDFKIKMGVNPNTVSKYSVYSIEVAHEMSKVISEFSSSDYGIGVTGKLNCEDEANPHGDKDEVFVSIYDIRNDEYHDKCVKVKFENRQKNKDLVIEEAMNLLDSII